MMTQLYKDIAVVILRTEYTGPCVGDVNVIMSTPPGMFDAPGFRSGYALLHKYSLSFDAWCY
jgi:hypothetical protein